MIAGVFLILQGSAAPPNEMKISYIGPEYLMWEHDTYVAYRLISNYLLSGISTFFISAALVYVSV